MDRPKTPIAIEAELVLGFGVDRRAPGGAVTAGLCGHWEHAGRCRWPHHSEIDASGVPARLRTIAIVSDDDSDEVVRRIETVLSHDSRWSVLSLQIGEVAGDEQPLAARLSEFR